MSIVTPTGRIVFHSNLFKTGGDKDKYSCALIFSKDQDLSKIKNLMLETSKETHSAADRKGTAKQPYSWGLRPLEADAEGNCELDFAEVGDLILNMDRNGTFSAPEVKGTTKGPDGKLEDLVEGDLKAGDHCRALISGFAWEYQKKKGVKLNFDAIQFVKEGEVYYMPPTSDNAFGEEAFDVEVEVSGSSSEVVDGEEAFDF